MPAMTEIPAYSIYSRRGVAITEKRGGDMAQKKKVKLEDIAKKLDVSIVTVSNALKGKKGVSEETRDKIIQTAREMGYHSAPREKKIRDSHIIGAVVAERYVREFPSFYMEVYKNISQEAMKRGSLTMLEVVSREKENLEEKFSAFQNCEVEGVILIGEMKKEYIHAVRREYKNVPIVCVDYYDVYEDMDYIVTDGFGGMEQMTRLMLKEGIRNLAFVGTVNATKNIMDRYLGYCKALDRAGIEDAKYNIIPDRDSAGEVFDLNLQLPEQLPQGFVCNCDRTAFVVIRKLKERGMRVPEDISVVGFDNYPTDTFGGQQLSTYRNDEQVLARLSIHTMICRIEGKKKPEGIRIVEGSVVRGGSVKFRRQQDV